MGISKITLRRSAAVFFIIFLILCLGLSWFTYIKLEPGLDINAYRNAIAATAQNVHDVADTKYPEASLKIYAVNVFHNTPFEKTVIGGGVYFRDGLIITAAHVAGNWPYFQNLRVLIAGQDLPASVIKEGSLENVDLALLSVDKSRLPVSLLLRKNPICKGPLRVGARVLVVYPTRLKPSKIISPLMIFPQYRGRFGSVINEPEGSGFGLFDYRRKCLLGIMSRSIEKLGYGTRDGRLSYEAVGSAGYFVPAQKIETFIPAGLRF